MFKLRLMTLVFLMSTSALVNAQKFYWGVNGHPLNQVDYKPSTLDDQIKYLKDLQVNIYRMDVRVDENGKAKKDDAFLSVLQKLKDNNIEPMPTVMPSGISGSTPQQYDDSFKQGQQFCKTYGSYFNVIEVGNEIDNACILKTGNDGSKRSHYNTDKMNNILVKIKGFIDGAKSVKPSLKVSLSLSWVHFGYLDMLEDNKVNYDIIGYHWYSNMGDPTNAKQPYGNVLKKVADTYHKPIWVTEFNSWQGSYKMDFEKQNNYVMKTIKTLLSQNVVSGLFMYELFDQPSLRANNAAESYYGLLYKDNTGNYVKKDVYNGYKDIITKYYSKN